VAGALPITPAGLGVIDSLTPLLLVSFGITRSVATLGVLGWRLVNFWLPIPAGAAAYVSLKVPRGAGPKAMRAAVSALLARDNSHHEASPDATQQLEASPDAAQQPEAQDHQVQGSGTQNHQVQSGQTQDHQVQGGDAYGGETQQRETRDGETQR
jgi:hypothetical protein